MLPRFIINIVTFSIFSNGKEYISAGRAGELVGYSGDYVGQLCRAQKIPCKLIGRIWYVELEALQDHRRTRQLGKPRGYKNMARALEVLPEEGASISLEKVEKSVLPGTPVSGLKYGREEAELLPTLSKTVESSTRSNRPLNLVNLVKNFSIATLALIAVVMTGISTLEQVTPNLAYSLETRVAGFSKRHEKFNPESFLGSSWTGFRRGLMGEGEPEKPLQIRLTREEIRALLMGENPK